jgi:cell shape-determining protein MreD
MAILFILGLLIDLYLGNFLGKSSLILLILYGISKMLWRYLPKKAEKDLRLKL